MYTAERPVIFLFFITTKLAKDVNYFLIIYMMTITQFANKSSLLEVGAKGPLNNIEYKQLRTL